jgi:hypothetical protein
MIAARQTWSSIQAATGCSRATIIAKIAKRGLRLLKRNDAQGASLRLLLRLGCGGWPAVWLAHVSPLTLPRMLAWSANGLRPNDREGQPREVPTGLLLALPGVTP